MRVVELVPLLVEDPEPVAADLVPAHGEDRSVGDGDERLPELAEDVVTVVIGHVRARGTVRVDVRRRTVDREHVVPCGQLRVQLERRRLHPGASLWTQPRRIAGARVVGRALDGLGGRGRDGRGDGGRGLDVGFGIADLDLAPCRQAAVVGGQSHVELGDEAAIAARAGRRGAIGSLGADRQLAPVAERDLRHVRGDRLPLDLQIRDGAPVRVAACARVARARGGAGGDRVGRDLALEERQRRHDALRARGRVGDDGGGGTRRRRLRRDDRAVGRIREHAAGGGRGVRRGDDRGRRHGGCTGCRDLDRPGRRRRARGARRPLSAGRPEGEQREGQKQCEAAAHHP